MKCRQAVSILLLAATMVSCGPSDSAQTVGFVLDLGSKRLDRVAFRVRYSAGGFQGDDGSCVPGSRVEPDSAIVVVPASAVAVPPTAALDTTTTTTSTSSTSTSTTTSTTLPITRDCTVTFRLQDAITFASLQWDTDYTASGGEFLGSGGDVACRFLGGSILFIPNDADAQRVLTIGLVILDGLAGPANLVECDFSGPEVPQKSDFPISITDAVDVEGEEFDPEPTVVVQSIVCADLPTTTTTTSSTTTTTLPTNPCGNGTLGAGEECDDGNLVNGDGCDSNCDLEDAFDSVVSPGELNVDIVHRGGIPPGAALAFCKFQGDVTSSTFRINVTACSLDNSDGCNTTSDAVVKVSTTTTTTSTTVTTTSTEDTTTTTTLN